MEVCSSEILLPTKLHSIASEKALSLADRPTSSTSALYVVQFTLHARFYSAEHIPTHLNTVVFIRSVQQCSEHSSVDVPTSWSHNEILPLPAP